MIEPAYRLNCLVMLLCLLTPMSSTAEERPRARAAGLAVGVFKPGPENAITDVDGVKVGHATRIAGDDIRTGVTAIIPAGGDLFARPLSAAVHVGNGYGKSLGLSQIRELGQIETPILLTCTLCVWSAANALKDWIYDQPGMPEATVNPVVGECNDAIVNNMWADPIGREEVYAALESARAGPVAEGSVGAGTGTQAFAWKGGIGTSSRVLPSTLGGHRVGVLVQTNYGGVLTIGGAPVGRSLGRYAYRDIVEEGTAGGDPGDGSIMIIVATDAPLDARQLERVARRAIMGLARTGSFASNGSGDYVIAFSTSEAMRVPREGMQPLPSATLTNPAMSPLFAATAEATEEAIYNAIFRATTVESARGKLEAIPIDALLGVLDEHRLREPPAN